MEDETRDKCSIQNRKLNIFKILAGKSHLGDLGVGTQVPAGIG
jgi:hypothetical protein